MHEHYAHESKNDKDAKRTVHEPKKKTQNQGKQKEKEEEEKNVMQ